MANTPTPERLSELDELRGQLIDKILGGVLILSAVGVPASVSRITFTGWLPMYGVHIGLMIFIGLLWMFRARVHQTLKISVIIMMFWLVGLVGLLTLGLVGAGAWWMVSSALLIEIIYGNKAGIRAAIAVAFIVLIFAVLFVSGVLTLGVDTNAFSTRPEAWATFMVGAVLQPLIVFSGVGALHNTIVSLHARVEAQAEEIQLLADTDELTTLPRRHVAIDRLEQQLLPLLNQREKSTTAVLFFDLNGFKQINDTYGHATGDRILQATASRSRTSLRASDTIARNGGDEFLAILPKVGGIAEAMAIAEKLVAAISTPIGSGELNLSVGVSVGIALAPEHGDSAEALITAADLAMYEAKRKGNNQICVAVAQQTTTENNS